MPISIVSNDFPSKYKLKNKHSMVNYGNSLAFARDWAMPYTSLSTTYNRFIDHQRFTTKRRSFQLPFKEIPNKPPTQNAFKRSLTLRLSNKLSKFESKNTS